jgi:uncharacterized oligopeptide transporter (OPT) family protein
MSSPADKVEASEHAGADPDKPLCEKPPGVVEFTIRSIIVGLVVSIIVAASYPYMVLKLGFGPNISVVSAFFGYLILGLAFKWLAKTFNRWENNIIQTAGTAGGQTAFLCVLMAAFDYLRQDPSTGFHFSLTPLQTFLWLTTAGTLGALLAVPMRQHFIVDEKLRFPDGVAVAETLIILDSRGPSALRATIALVAGMVLSAKDALWVILGKAPDTISFGSALAVTGVGINLSWLSFGSGMLVGMRINTSMVLGAIASWVVAPFVLRHYGVIHTGYAKRDVLNWVMWPATGMLVAGGLAALVFRWRVMAKTFKQLAGAKVGSNDFPIKWVIVGSLISAAALVLVQWYFLHMEIWMTVVAILLTVPLMLVGLRVLGETNWGPISALSNLMQGIFGLLSPGNIQHNMVASGVTGSVAIESEALMQDFKTGHLIGSTPRYMTYMQLLAVPLGALVVAYMYPALRESFGLGGSRTIIEERVTKVDRGAFPPESPTVFIAPDDVHLPKHAKKGDTLVLVTTEKVSHADDKGKTVSEYLSATLPVVDVQGNRATLEKPLPPELKGRDLWWRVERTRQDSLTSPISQKWSSFAKILSQGWGALPKGAAWALLVGCILGIAFTALEQDKRLKTFTPSPTGVGIGMLVPASVIITMFLGGLVQWIWTAVGKKSSDQYSVPLASGLIAGDAIIYTVVAILAYLGWVNV